MVFIGLCIGMATPRMELAGGPEPPLGSARDHGLGEGLARREPLALGERPSYGRGLMLALTWLGFLRWLGTILLAIALVVVVMGLILYLMHVSGTSGGGGDWDV